MPIFDRTNAALITKGTQDTSRFGDQIQLRGIKLNVRMTQLYDGYDSVDATPVYKKYRLIVYASRYRIEQETSLATVSTYETPHYLDLNSIPYQYTSNLSQPNNFKPNRNDIKVLYNDYFEFFPQGALNETPAGVAIQSARYAAQNIYQLDTYIKFPC